MPSRRALLRGSLTTAATLLAGCTADETVPQDSPTDSPESTPGPTPDSPTPAPTPTGEDGDSTPTDIGRTTPYEPVGTGRNPADVVLSNGDNRPREIRVTARRTDASDPHYDQSVALDPEERYRMDPLMDDASGTHVFEFRLDDGTERIYEWDLSEQSEDGWLSVGVTADGAFVVQYAIA